MAKLKVSIPLNELMKNNSYKGQVFKILNLDPSSNMVNVEDDRPELIFGPALESQSQDSDVAPFYISLRVHDYVLHNAMFDFGASHNLMPKAIMEKFGLDITRKYHDLYSFDSSRVRCIGLSSLCLSCFKTSLKFSVISGMSSTSTTWLFTSLKLSEYKTNDSKSVCT